MSAPIYLFRKPSSRTYFFRCSIPLDLCNHFDGRQEFRVSLASKSKTRSQQAACCLHSIVQDIYAQIRSGETQMTVEEIKVVLRIELERSFRYIKHIQLRTNIYNPQKVQEAISNLQHKKEIRLRYIKIAESGRKRVQGFFGVCGTSLYAADADKQKFNIRLGFINQRDQLVPSKHIFGDSAASWLKQI